MLDIASGTVPDFDGILKTMGGALTLADEKLLDETCAELYAEVSQRGYVREITFDRLGYRLYKNSKGEVVLRDSEANHLRRACILSHDSLKSSRAPEVASAGAEIAAAAGRKSQAILNWLSLSKECEAVLLKQISPHPTDVDLLSTATLSHFEGCTATHLAAYIQCRILYDIKRGAWKSVNNGSAAKAVADEDCLVLQAFKLRRPFT